MWARGNAIIKGQKRLASEEQIAGRKQIRQARTTCIRLEVLDGLLPEILDTRIGADTILAVKELVGAASAQLKELIAVRKSLSQFSPHM